MKEKLKNREKVFGAWTSIGHPQIAEVLCRSGVDFIGIDMEHSTITQAEAQRIIAACHANGVLCLPRVGSHNEEMVKRVLDSGADGIIFPMVENGEQAKELDSWTKYPPLGKRNFGVARAQGYGFDFDEYVRNWNEKCIVIAQIESKEGVDNLEDIIHWVDAIMVGPYDLSGSLGVPGELNSKVVMDTCQEIIDACQKYGLPCGTQMVEPDKYNVKKAFNMGYSFIVMASDVFILAKNAKDTKKIIESVI